jgi:hypothetical protein
MIRIEHRTGLDTTSETHQLGIVRSLNNTAHDTPATTASNETLPYYSERPSRQYQTLLLISGFLMIFHVIGIGQVYGIFQVNIYLILDNY